ncbi:hypothetical protein [Neobacillus sp. SuZ13]|uniref:hypothetical protein n=1 Tax=Neobacillus sp. SuZ13 TaxID=3047875 RepID=UPI0024C0645E|nr:hypothetical protein [Neobacillus sp. SuZ13]WHY69483.1 hypothetical protein QNH17_12935 [Neobacillus sp. SuZ13]
MDTTTKQCDNKLKELIIMELIVGLISFVGDLIAAWAMSAWSYYQEKTGNN